MIGRPALLLAGALLAAIALGSSASAQGVAAEDRDRVELIDRVAKSVVHVRVEQETPAVVGTPASTDRELEALLDKYAGRRARKPEEGSGFVIDSARRLVLTAAHIVDNAKSITVGLPGGGTDPAQVVGIDPEGGIALLRAATELPALALADREPKPGETALIVGWMIPLKSVMPVEGMVMGAAPAVDDSPAAPPFARYVALDAVIPNGGFGGSPVLDQSGKVIGMVSAIYGRDYGPGSLTMMIPTAAMAHHVSQLAAAGKVTRSGIGITVDCPSANCFVDSVEGGGTAAAAGVREGDALIAVDGVKVASVPQVQRAIGSKAVGSSVALTLYRGGGLHTVSVVTAARD